jgi:hypothetical protein
MEFKHFKQMKTALREIGNKILLLRKRLDAYPEDDESEYELDKLVRCFGTELYRLSAEHPIAAARLEQMYGVKPVPCDLPRYVNNGNDLLIG